MSLRKEFEPIEASFLQTPDQINTVEASSVFNSVIEQIDRGDFRSIDELRDQTTIGRQSILSPNRQSILESDQQAIAESEFMARESLNRARQSTTDLASFGMQVIQGSIQDNDELNARFTAMQTSSGIVLLPTGPLLENGAFVYETRKLDEGQKEVIESIFAACRQRDQTTEQLASLRRSLRAVDNLSAAEKQIYRMEGLESVRSKVLAGNVLASENRAVLNENQITIIDREIDAASQLSEAVDRAANYLAALRQVLKGDITSAEQLDTYSKSKFTGQLTQPQIEKLTNLTAQLPRLDARTRDGLRTQPTVDQLAQIVERLTDESGDALTQNERSQKDTQSEITEDIQRELNRAVCTTDFLQMTQAADTTDQINAVVDAVVAFEEASIDDNTVTSSIKELITARKMSIETRRSLDIANQVSSNESAIDYIFGLDRPTDDRYTQILTILYKKELANFKIGGYELILNQRNDRRQLADYIANTPVRREIAGLDFTMQLFEIEQELELVSEQLTKNKTITSILSQFPNGNPSDILEMIQDQLGDNGEELLAARVIDRYRSYIAARRSKRESAYEFLFSDLVEKARQNLIESYNFDEGLGDNKAAARYLSSQYRTVFMPIVNAFKHDPDTQSVRQYMASSKPSDLIRRENYIIDTEALAEQRPLTEIEEAYLRSVELLSFFNPELTAVANADPDALSVYLKNHFAKLDAQTFSNLSDGDYVPLIQIGLGAEGLVSAGEIVRKQPELAAQTLYIDADGIGGPFAIPNGPAFGLNSANRFGFAYTLPPVNQAIERQTVRAFGSPLRWYPGERNPQQDVRQGSINMSVDYLPAVDDISDGRYANNADEALTLQIQAAMVVKNVLLGTRVVDQYFTDKPGRGNKIVVLERPNPDGSMQQFTLRTDYFISATGLGEPNYGISQNTSAQLLRQNEQIVASGGFPIFDAPLNIFKALVDKDSTNKPQPGKVFAIYGGGNTADTFVENLSRIFTSGNKLVRNIEKVYIVTDNDLSRRPRYAAAKDLLARNGRTNLLEIVPGRVDNIELTSSESGDQKLRLSQNRSLIRNSKGQPIVADTVIPATGFRSRLPELLAKTSGLRRDSTDVLNEQTLPTDERIAVADRLKNDPDQLIVGVASRTGFQGKGTAKFTQLQIDAREALLRNGAENAVAIGFRGPDTQAAVRLFIEDRVGALATDESGVRNPQQSVRLVNIEQRSKQTSKKLEVQDSRSVSIRQGTKGNSAILTALTLYELGIVKVQSGSSGFTGDVTFSLTPQNDGTVYTAKSNTKAARDWSQSLVNNPYFRAYAEDAIARRRGANSITASIYFKNGRIDTAQTYVQAT